MKSLYDILSDYDKCAIYDYIVNYGKCRPQNLEAVLSSWAKNKRTLYKALGGKLRVEIPYQRKADYNDLVVKLRKEYRWLVNVNRASRNVSGDFYIAILDWILGMQPSENELWLDNGCSPCLDLYLFKFFDNVFYEAVLFDTYHNGLPQAFVFSEIPGSFKELKIPKGIKPVRAVRKVLLHYGFPRIDLFEKWRDKLSAITTTKKIDTTLVISIHPLDFMSMSDTGKWSSCMTWIRDGMYNAGTIEMMNSNVAVVAYLKGEGKFTTKGGYDMDVKVWRSLFYVHKYILLSGKSYPYGDDELTKFVLKTLKDLVKKNLKWDYRYGIQEYLDMLKWGVNQTCRRVKLPKQGKHIYCYTYGMYNDILEDHDTTYYCYRNVPKKNMRISLSGYATCLICGDRIDDLPTSIDDCRFTAHGERKYCGGDKKHYNNREVDCYDCHRHMDAKEALKIRIKVDQGSHEFADFFCMDCALERVLYYHMEDKTRLYTRWALKNSIDYIEITTKEQMIELAEREDFTGVQWR